MRVFARFRQAPERRASDRFPIERDVVLKPLGRSSGQEPILGKTINISSKGVLLSIEGPLPQGRRLEVSISWPAQLNGACNLKLVAQGRVVRSDGRSVAIELDRYEFRTARSKGLGRLAGVQGLRTAMAGSAPAARRGNANSEDHHDTVM